MPAKRPGRIIRLVERVVLGTGMTIAAIVVERKLRKATREKMPGRSDDLTVGPDQIEDQPRG